VDERRLTVVKFSVVRNSKFFKDYRCGDMLPKFDHEWVHVNQTDVRIVVPFGATGSQLIIYVNNTQSSQKRTRKSADQHLKPEAADDLEVQSNEDVRF